MELNIDEALRYLGGGDHPPEELRRQVEELAGRLTAAIKPRSLYRVFPLSHEGEGISLVGTGLILTGGSARRMLAQCDRAAVLACTLGAGFDTMLRAEQARGMAGAVILDACGSAWVEAGCDAAEEELKARFPGDYLTDRFSPGYGDLPLALQSAIGKLLDAPRRLGVHVSEDMLLNPVKSVTAFLGISDRPQAARIRGCEFCAMNQTCDLRKGGKTCGI